MKEAFGHKYMTRINLEHYKVPRKGIVHLLDGWRFLTAVKFLPFAFSIFFRKLEKEEEDKWRD